MQKANLEWKALHRDLAAIAQRKGYFSFFKKFAG